MIGGTTIAVAMREGLFTKGNRNRQLRLVLLQNASRETIAGVCFDQATFAPPKKTCTIPFCTEMLCCSSVSIRMLSRERIPFTSTVFRVQPSSLLPGITPFLGLGSWRRAQLYHFDTSSKKHWRWKATTMILLQAPRSKGHLIYASFYCIVRFSFD